MKPSLNDKMPYVKYYTIQSGHGLGDIGAIYRAPLVIQKGRGIGSFFSGLGRFLKPLFVSGLDALRDQSLKTGQNILRDIGSKPLRTIIRDQTIEAAQGLADKAVNKLKWKMQDGSGKTIKRRKLKIKRHLRCKRKRINNDIFS